MREIAATNPATASRLRSRWVAYGIPWFMFSLVWLAGSMAVGYQIHESYWNKTIRRVQTVDFNMLHSFLPTKLSHLVQTGDFDELQSTVDSNFGYFGLVVTDARTAGRFTSDERILCYSLGGGGKRREWHEKLSPEDLRHYPYDVLRWPAPVAAEWAYRSSRDELGPHPTGRTNEGEIIGRVYYIRGSPPEFRIAEFWEKVFDLGSDSDTTLMHQFGTLVLLLLTFLLGLLMHRETRHYRSVRIESEKNHLRRERAMERQLVLFRTLHGDLARGADSSRQQLQAMALDADGLIREILRDERHDLKNDLQSLEPETQRELVVEVYRQAVEPAIGRILKMIDGLPDEISLEMTLHSLSAVAAALEEGFPPSVVDSSYYDFRLGSEFDADLGERCRVEVNLHRLVNILKNLVRNSGAAISRRRTKIRRSDPDGLAEYRGEVNVVLRVAKADGRQVLEIEVADNAGGFPEEFLDRIYCEPVPSTDRRVSREGEGTICVGEFTRLMGGDVEALNRYAEADLGGAVTILRFPINCDEGSAKS